MIDSVLFNGKMFQVINRKIKKNMMINNHYYSVGLDYELIKRAPGVRAIIVNNNKILLNKEYRYEINDWDYRLPGGKVFDSLEEYQNAINKKNLDKCIIEKLNQELIEEAEIVPIKFDFYCKSLCGFTVEWDLYYYIVYDFKELNTSKMKCLRKNEYEFIEHCWVDYKTAFDYCMEKKISEERSSNTLIRFLYNNFLRVK